MLVITFYHQTEAAPADAKKEDPPKSPSLLAKLLAPFKAAGERVRSPKKDKKVRIRLHNVVS
jgi:hypothetical protein